MFVKSADMKNPSVLPLESWYTGPPICNISITYVPDHVQMNSVLETESELENLSTKIQKYIGMYHNVFWVKSIETP